MSTRTPIAINLHNRPFIIPQRYHNHDHNKTLKKYIQNIYSNQSSPDNKSIIRHSFDNSPNPSEKSNIKQIFTFQKQFVRTLTKKQSILDARKLTIKEKIKGKVKQQLAELIKKPNSIHCSHTQVYTKKQDNQSRVHNNKTSIQVEIKGSSMRKSLQPAISERPQLMKLQKIRMTKNKRSISLLKQSRQNDKISTSNSSQRDKQRARRSLSKVNKLNSISPRKMVRKIYSALDQTNVIYKKESLQIEPWQYIEEW